MAEGLEAPCYNVKRQLPFEEPVAGKKKTNKKKTCLIWWVDAADVSVGRAAPPSP